MSAPLETVVLVEGKLTKEILAYGEGDATPKSGDEVVAHYTGRLENGEVFDSSVERGQPFKVRSAGRAATVALGRRAGDCRELASSGARQRDPPVCRLSQRVAPRDTWHNTPTNVTPHVSHRPPAAPPRPLYSQFTIGRGQVVSWQP